METDDPPQSGFEKEGGEGKILALITVIIPPRWRDKHRSSP